MKDNTITILVKDVNITSRLGRIARPVKIITSLTGVDHSCVFWSEASALSTTSFSSDILGIADFAVVDEPELTEDAGSWVDAAGIAPCRVLNGELIFCPALMRADNRTIKVINTVFKAAFFKKI
jgi:hypothetical protein